MRKARRNHKKRKKILVFSIVLILLAGIALAYTFFSPIVKGIIKGDKKIKSGYVNTGNKDDALRLLDEKNIKYKSFKFADEGETYEIKLEKGIVVKLSDNKRLEEQINTLQELLRRITIDNKDVKEIDLRARPIVKF